MRAFRSLLLWAFPLSFQVVVGCGLRNPQAAKFTGSWADPRRLASSNSVFKDRSTLVRCSRKNDTAFLPSRKFKTSIFAWGIRLTAEARLINFLCEFCLACPGIRQITQVWITDSKIHAEGGMCNIANDVLRRPGETVRWTCVTGTAVQK